MQASARVANAESNSVHFLQRTIRSCVWAVLCLTLPIWLLKAFLKPAHNDNILPLLELVSCCIRILLSLNSFVQTLTILHAYSTTPSLEILRSSDATCWRLRKSVFL